MRKWLIWIPAFLLAVICGCSKPAAMLPPTTVLPPATTAAHIHSYVVHVIKPTCTQAGCSVHVCACGHSYVTDTCQPSGHILSPWETAQEPTEETEGVRRRHCIGCDLTEEAAIAVLQPGHSHSYTETVAAADCLQPGYTTYSCSCGDQYIDQQVPALGHSFSNYESNKDATCVQDGTMTARCDRCGIEDTQPHPGSATGHQYVSNVTPPTCQAEGYTQYLCACGDSYTGDPTEKTAHSWGEWSIIREATETQEGLRQRRCANCPETQEETVPYDPVQTQPTRPSALTVVSWSETVGRNETATVTIQGKPGVEYDIDVQYKSGVSTAKGLENQLADENGFVTWTWKIGNRTAAGSYEIVITGGGETITIEFTVVP